MATTLISVSGLVLASVVLIAAGAAIWLIFAFAVLQGASLGLLSILRPVLSADVLGRRGFGAITGVMAMGPLLATAAAPVTGALLQDRGGAMALLIGSLTIALLAVMLALILRVRVKRD